MGLVKKALNYELEDTQNGIDELNKSLKELGIGNVELNTKSNDYTKGNEI